MGTSTLVEIGDMPVIVHCSLFLVHWDPFLKNVGGSNKITSTCWETFEVKLWVLNFETHTHTTRPTFGTEVGTAVVCHCFHFCQVTFPTVSNAHALSFSFRRTDKGPKYTPTLSDLHD